MRKPSPETELRRYKAMYNDAEAKYSRLLVERDLYRQRATKAEQECAEWKARFDILLRTTDPKAKP